MSEVEQHERVDRPLDDALRGVSLSPEDVSYSERWAESTTTSQVAAAMREKWKLERLVKDGLREGAGRKAAGGEIGVRFYRVWNGYVGYSGVHVLVAAPDEDTARELAAERFREHADERSEMLPSHGYDESYWSDLEVEELCDGESPWAGGPYD